MMIASTIVTMCSYSVTVEKTSWHSDLHIIVVALLLSRFADVLIFNMIL